MLLGLDSVHMWCLVAHLFKNKLYNDSSDGILVVRLLFVPQ